MKKGFNNLKNHEGDLSISQSKRFFIFIAESMQQSPATNTYIVYLAFVVSYFDLCSYTHDILDQVDQLALNPDQTGMATRYYLKAPTQFNEVYYFALQYLVPFRFLNQYGLNTFASNFTLLFTIFAFNIFIILAFIYGFYLRQNNNQKEINYFCQLACRLCTFYNGLFLLPQSEILTSLVLNGCISLRYQVCPLMNEPSNSTNLIIIRVFAAVNFMIVFLLSSLNSQLSDQTTNSDEKGMQKIYINKITHSLQLCLKFLLPFIYFNSTQSIPPNSVSLSSQTLQSVEVDLSINTQQGIYFFMMQCIIIAFLLLDWDEFIRFVTYTNLKKVTLYIVLQFITFLFMVTDILYNQAIVSRKLQILIMLIATPLFSLLYIEYTKQTYSTSILQLLQDVTVTRDHMDESITKDTWKNLNRKIAIYKSMEDIMNNNQEFQFNLISTMVCHNRLCREVACSCNKTKICNVFSSNQLAVNYDHYHEYLEFLIQVHTKQQNFYQEQNIYLFIQYLSYLISRHKFTEVAGKTTYLIREKMRGALNLNFFMDVQVEALLKISKNSMIGDFQSKITEQKQYEAFLQAGKFLKVESTLSELVQEIQELIQLKINLYNVMQQGFNTYYHLIKEASLYLGKINSMERKLIKFHDFASYSYSRNLLTYFYTNIQGDIRKANYSQKLRCTNNAERPIMNDVLMAFSSKVVTVTASVGKNYGSILAYSEKTPEFFGYEKKDFFLVKRIEQLMPNCMASKHKYMVDNFVQTGDSVAVREKRLVLIKKSREILSPAQIFLCFNFSYLDDFVFTAFFCEPETKDYDPKKETILVFDQRMKLSGYSENLTKKLGVKKINQRDAARIELQDVFPQIEIEEVMESESIEYSNAQFQFPMLNHQSNSNCGSSKMFSGRHNESFNDKSMVMSTKSYKTIKSMNSTQFKNQEWFLFLCELRVITRFRQFRSGETLQYFYCTVKDMREESVKSDGDSSTQNTDFSDLEEMKDGKMLKEVSINSFHQDEKEDNEQEYVGKLNEKVKNITEQANKPQLSYQKCKDGLDKSTSQINKSNSPNKRKSTSINNSGFNKKRIQAAKDIEIEKEIPQKNNQIETNKVDSQLMNQTETGELQSEPKKQDPASSKTNKQLSRQITNNSYLKKQKSNQTSGTSDLNGLANPENEKENEEEINRKIEKQQSNVKKTEKNNVQTAFRTVTKKQSILHTDQREIFKEQITQKTPEQRKKMIFKKKKHKNDGELADSKKDEEIPQSFINTLKQTDDPQTQNISMLQTPDQLNVQITQSPQQSNRSAITTIESEIRIDPTQLNITTEKRKIDTDVQNNSHLPLMEGVLASPYCDMSEIVEDTAEYLPKENSSVLMAKALNQKEESKVEPSEQQSTFKSKSRLRQSILKVQQKIKEQNEHNRAELLRCFSEKQILSEGQKISVIKQILKMLQNSPFGRSSITEEQLLDMDPLQLFQKYNQIYYNNYAKTKKGKNDLSYVQSDEEQSHHIIFKKGEAESHKYDDRYDYKKYEENMLLIDKYSSTNLKSSKLNLVKLMKLAELILIIVGMVVSKISLSNIYDIFNQQMNILKSYSIFRDYLNQFTSLIMLTNATGSTDFESNELNYFTANYLSQLSTQLSDSSLNELYDSSQISFVNIYNQQFSPIMIDFRTVFFLNAYYLQNTSERLQYFSDMYLSYNENVVSLVTDNLASLTSQLSSQQVSSIVMFICILISLVTIFALGAFVFYRYQKDQRWLQKLICNVPLRQIEIEKCHLDKIKKLIENESQNVLKYYKLSPFDEEIEKRMDEFKQEHSTTVRNMSESAMLGKKNQVRRIHKANNYIVIKSKSHTEQDYKNNILKYNALYADALNQINQYEALLYKDNTLEQSLLDSSQISNIRNYIINANVCDSITIGFSSTSFTQSQLKTRCTNIFDGILPQGAKLTLSFLQNRYSIFQYQSSNYLPELMANELTFYLFQHTQSILNLIESYYTSSFNSNSINNTIYLIIILTLVAIIYLVILLLFFKRLKQYQKVTRQLIYLVPFTTIQLEESLIKQIKKYTLNKQ